MRVRFLLSTVFVSLLLPDATLAQTSRNQIDVGLATLAADHCGDLATVWSAMRGSKYGLDDTRLSQRIDGFIRSNRDCRGNARFGVTKGSADQKKIEWLRIAAVAHRVCTDKSDAPACQPGGQAHATLEPLGLAPKPAPAPTQETADQRRDRLICGSEEHQKKLAAQAEQGDSKAMYLVGGYHRYGWCGRAVDSIEARRWIEKAAAAGDNIAISALGQMYLKGEGGPRNEAEALRLIELAATRGVVNDDAVAGGLYFDGIGTKRDLVKARHWLERGARHSSTAREKLAKLNVEEGRDPAENRDLLPPTPKALRCHQLAAYTRDKQRYLGVRGVGGSPADRPEALAACAEAYAESPNDPRLALQYARTLNETKSNLKLMIELLNKAIAGGQTYALVVLASHHTNGHGVPLDFERARRLYEEAAKAENGFAMHSIGRLYENGSGVKQDFAQAQWWYEKAAASGEPLAMTQLGYLHQNGNGVKQDFAQAMWWYGRAAAAGEVYAMTQLGFLHQNSNGVTRDYRLAKQWLDKAANLGDTNAIYEIGRLYYNSLGVRRDRAEADRWFQKAAAGGHKQATEWLAQQAKPSRAAQRGQRRGSGSSGSGSDEEAWYNVPPAKIPTYITGDGSVGYGYAPGGCYDCYQQ